MNLKERFEWLMRMALLIFILAAASFLSAITAIRFAIHGREVEMPSLVGRTAADAQRMLSARGLRMKIADRVYSDLPAEQVVRQSPTPGMRMKVSQPVHVVLSLGRRTVTIPRLESKSLRAARIELLRLGLEVGEISNIYLPEFQPDAVIVQDPGPGTGATSPHVNLLVSAGVRERAYIMPHLVGLDAAEAQRQLMAAGLRAVKTVPVTAPEWPPGAVTDQAPAHGARVAASVTVELRVAQ